jgi:hypothetical protein
MGNHRLLAAAVAASAIAAVTGLASAQPRPDLGSPSATAWPKPCDADVLKAARWFVRELDEGTVTPEQASGWRSWRGTTVDEGQLIPVLYLKLEAIDPSSRSYGAVSGWLEVDGAPDGMQVTQLDPDQAAATLPDRHFVRSLGRWRLVRALVDGTPKEQSVVVKALDRCAAALQAPPKRPRRR